ncbi:c-type cytochrome [Anaerobacillus sp. MEB173]|uniref:c-type cytochrome n=1 Tax=Anaerobacillus sp. MEB173 TaxID=3383345 RepID=UPI003F93C481
MKNTVLIFFLTFFVAFGGGYLFYQSKAPADVTADSPPPVTEAEETENNDAEPTEVATEGESIPEEARAIRDFGCLQCHRVSTVGMGEAMTGPDLSDAFNVVEGKHGKSIEEYLKEPTTAVMSSVMDTVTLSDEQIQAIVDALQYVSEN